MVINHGDRKSPKDRVVGRFQMAVSMAYKWGDPNHLQVLG